MPDGDATDALMARHKELEQALERETRRPMPDFTVTQNIKRLKLQIKDQLARTGRA